MKKITVIGAKGKMGTLVVGEINSSIELKVYAEVDKDNDLSKAITDTDACIDFSIPKLTILAVNLCREYRKPIVIGTTGIDKNGADIITKASGDIPIVWTANYSIGVNLVYKLTELASKILRDEFKLDIVETHHIHKKDRPSGTAKTLMKIAVDNFDVDENKNISIHEEVFQNDNKKMRVLSVRKGEVVGDHLLRFYSPYEEVVISHSAFTRMIFAKGAVMALRWVLDKPNGLYTMANVLGF